MRIPENVATPATAAMLAVPESVPPPGLVPMASVTDPVNPAATLLLASSALTWMAGVIPDPAVALLGATENTRCVAPPDVTVTVSVWVTATPPIVALTILVPATVDDRAPVATPLPSVGEGGCVTVFPVPVAARTAVRPGIGLPNASRAVAVMTELPPAAMVVGEAPSVD